MLLWARRPREGLLRMHCSLQQRDATVCLSQSIQSITPSELLAPQAKQSYVYEYCTVSCYEMVRRGFPSRSVQSVPQMATSTKYCCSMQSSVKREHDNVFPALSGCFFQYLLSTMWAHCEACLLNWSLPDCGSSVPAQPCHAIPTQEALQWVHAWKRVKIYSTEQFQYPALGFRRIRRFRGYQEMHCAPRLVALRHHCHSARWIHL